MAGTLALAALLPGRLASAASAPPPSDWVAWPVPTASAAPEGIATGADSNLWVTEKSAGKILRLAPSGHAVEWTLPPGSTPEQIVSGPDGALWFTDPASARIGRITTSGVVTETLLASGAGPFGIAAGGDGRLWFTEERMDRIGALSPAGVLSEYALPAGFQAPWWMAAAPDGTLWFSDWASGWLGHVALDGTVKAYAVPNGASDGLAGLAVTPDGAVWFAEQAAGRLGRLAPAGGFSDVGLTAGAAPAAVTLGPDGASAWATEPGAGQLARVDLSGNLTEFPAPSGGARPQGVVSGPDGNLWFTEGTADDVVDFTLDVPGPASTYHPVTPYRLFDTRDGTGGVPARPLGPGGVLTVTAAGAGPLPSTGLTALVLNVTVTDETSAGYLSVWPEGSTRPLVSALNFTAGDTVPNLVHVAVGSSGEVSFYNALGSVDVLADVAGYYTAGTGPDGLFNPLLPYRVLDTRQSAPIAAGGTVGVQVTGVGGVPPGGVSAVVVNLTATNATAPSFISAWPDGSPRPTASNLNFLPGQTVPNRAVVKVGVDGRIDLYNLAGTADLVVDVDGWFTDGSSAAGGSRFVALKPARILDTRTGNGGYSSRLGAGASMAVYAAYGAEFVPPYTGPAPPKAVVGNLTVTGPSAPSFLTAYPDGTNRPLASDLNFTAGETVPNQLVVEVSQTDGRFLVYNLAGAVDVIFDVAGYYY